MSARALLWQRLDGPGSEYCVLSPHEDGWRLRGIALAVVDDRPVHATYTVRCDARWCTRAVAVEVTAGRTERSVRLTVDGRQRWWRGDQELPGLAGLIDVDLGLSPATNTLPIRRLELAVGDSREVTAAWVGLPDLGVERLPQRYTRLDDRRYRYESNHGASVTELEVDEAGLVVRYEGGWERRSIVAS